MFHSYPSECVFEGGVFNCLCGEEMSEEGRYCAPDPAVIR